MNEGSIASLRKNENTKRVELRFRAALGGGIKEVRFERVTLRQPFHRSRLARKPNKALNLIPSYADGVFSDLRA